MGNAPSLRNIIIKQFGQFLCSFPCNGISPGSKWHQQFSCFIKCHISVHHGTDTHRADLCKSHSILLFYICCQILIAGTQAFPDILQGIGPDPVFQAVFPLVTSLCNRGGGTVNQYRLDPGRTKLDPQRCSPVCYVISYFFYTVTHSSFFLPDQWNL